MGSQSVTMFPSFFVFTIFTCLLFSSPSQARKFDVGGKDGWVTKPSEDYQHWAQRMRFKVNDTLFFKYQKGSDSVLVVNKEDYNSCNINNPLQRLDGGDSSLVFDKSGPFYFISGKSERCQKGQKLNVVVMAVRPTPPAPTPNVGPSPSDTPAPAPAPNSATGGSVVGLAFWVSVGMTFILVGRFDIN